LLGSLKQLGINQTSLEIFTAETFIKTIVLCFERIAAQLSEKDQFIDMAFLKKQNLKEATNRYKCCQKFVNYLKTLNYMYDLSFNVFMNPNIKDTRRLLGFLFEFIFRSEESENAQSKRPTNEIEVLLRQRLNKWKKKPWVLSDFLSDQKKPMLISGTVINTRPGIDFDRVAASKSKKAKTIYTMMSNQFAITRNADAYRLGANILGNTLQASQFLKSQNTLSFGQGGGLLGGEDDEEMNTKNQGSSISQASIL
jgi:hypothetical protein